MSTPVAAWIHANPVAEWWGHGHDLGRTAVEQEFGADIRTVRVDDVGVGPEWTRAAHELAAGSSVVFVCDVVVTDRLADVAAQHPATRFVHCQGGVPSANIATFGAARDEHAYVSGILAGAASVTGVVGLVEGVPSDHDRLYTDAWVRGVRRSNPHARVEERWIGSYHDPDQAAKDRRAVLELAESGADVIGGNLAENAAVVEAAGEAGLFVTAHDERLSRLPQVLDASYLDWRPYYLRSVASVLDGTWRAEASYLRAVHGVVQNTEPAAWLPHEVKARAREARVVLEAGGRPWLSA